ncbi:hypothetical protein L798_04555 [Zootermopsis nevadensis]|uniref:Uncharacterized protein n=1 Tax=Zootermopsis nevadensis TaxID=136037 RepID=A0A067QSP2_ZOONE|nr:hypothetical protein L798_04555 [Zootermopsis nevadensis]
MNRIRMLAAENTELQNLVLFERRQGQKHKVSLAAVREENLNLRKERNLQAEQIKQLQAENFAATQLIEKLKAMKDDKTQVRLNFLLHCGAWL